MFYRKTFLFQKIRFQFCSTICLLLPNLTVSTTTASLPLNFFHESIFWGLRIGKSRWELDHKRTCNKMKIAMVRREKLIKRLFFITQANTRSDLPKRIHFRHSPLESTFMNKWQNPFHNFFIIFYVLRNVANLRRLMTTNWTKLMKILHNNVVKVNNALQALALQKYWKIVIYL